MVDFRESIVGAARNVFCRNAAPIGAAANYLEGIEIPIPGVRIPSGFQIAGRAASALLSTCPASGGPYGNPDPVNAVPGRCAVPYNIQGGVDVFTYGTYNRTLGYNSNRVGPLPQFIVSLTSNNVLLVDENGDTLANLGNRPTGTSSAEWKDGNPVITRVDGLPDECGADGQPIQPGDNIGGDETINYDDNNGNPVSETVNVNFNNPILTLDGDIVIGGVVIGPTYQVGVNLNLSTGDINLGLDGTNPDSAPCDLPGRTPEEPPDNEEDEPPEDPEGRIIGVFVTTDDAPKYGSATIVGDGIAPDLAFPRVGSVSFGVQVGTARAWLNPIDVQGKRMFIPCPWDDGAISVRGKPITGVEWQLDPAYKAYDIDES